MTYADVEDCLQADERTHFLSIMPESAYKGTRIKVQDAINMQIAEECEINPATRSKKEFMTLHQGDNMTASA